VTRVELRTDEKIAVTYSTATTGIKQTAIYDRIVCTIPSPACANIDWIGQSYDDAEFIKVINSFRLLSYFPLFKLSLQFSKRFWEDTSLFIDGYCVVGG
jgi:monoamine oxidase